MKNIFDIFEKNERIDGSEFITREISEELAIKQRQTSENLSSFEKQAKLPLWLGIVKLLTVAFATIFSVLIVIISVEKGFSEFLRASGWAIVVAICLWLAFFAIIFIGRVRQRETFENRDLHAELLKAERLLFECKNYLQIPENASEITVMGGFYRIKDGKRVSALPLASYVAIETFMFANSEKLFIADTNAVLSVDREKIKGYAATNEKLNFHGWSKSEHFLSEKYKKYKITADSYGVIHVTGALEVEIEGREESFKLIIPIFDRDKFFNVLGDSAKI